jgi:hypothetical protein
VHVDETRLKHSVRTITRFSTMGVDQPPPGLQRRNQECQASTRCAAMTDDEVHQVLEAAASINEFAALALRLAAETGARRNDLQ